jgi:hypothetical protein
MAGFLKAYRIEARHRLTRVLDVFPGAIQTPMLAGQTNYEKAMLPVEVAKTIFTVATLEYPSLQIEELHLGRFIL